MNQRILLTIDVEDWFQVENFKPWIPFSSWDGYELRVEKNTHRLLDLFDSFDFSEKIKKSKTEILRKKSAKGVNATFFVLGWIAERLPNLVREIHNRGHEVASHGFNHELCNKSHEPDLIGDLKKSKMLLEDTVGAEVKGYRAPSFSVNNHILKIIEDSGYEYDSSYNSFDRHERYGKVSLAGFVKKGIAYKISENFYELPISNLNINTLNARFPWGGGGYFRLMPGYLFNHGVRKILKKDSAYVLYLHPWEIDKHQPVLESAPRLISIRHSINIDKTHAKLRALIEKFSRCEFVTCTKYIKSCFNPIARS